jgi:MFS family permease
MDAVVILSAPAGASCVLQAKSLRRASASRASSRLSRQRRRRRWARRMSPWALEIRHELPEPAAQWIAVTSVGSLVLQSSAEGIGRDGSTRRLRDDDLRAEQARGGDDSRLAWARSGEQVFRGPMAGSDPSPWASDGGAMKPGTAQAASSAKRSVPRSIWTLGMVSLLMDISSEMIHALLPLFLTVVLAAPIAAVGWIEGFAEATASISKVFSGALSDYLGKRKLLAAVGYGLGTLSKPLIALAPSVAWVVVARFVDRLGKGIRGAPRDALVGELSPPELRGASYGLRQALDSVGAFAGPLLAVILLAVSGGDFRWVFWIAVCPAVASTALIVFGVREPVGARASREARAPIRRAELNGLGRAYWILVIAGALLALARFSEAFLILRVASVGVPAELAPLALVGMNAAYALSAYPLGWLSDRTDRGRLLARGIAVLGLSHALLAGAASVWAVAIGALLWGLHMGMTQGILAALVADATPAPLRGTAFGVFHLVGGVGMLLGSAVAGLLWDWLGPGATFAAGAAFAAIAWVVLHRCGHARPHR